MLAKTVNCQQLLNCTTADSDGHYTLLSYKFGMFFVTTVLIEILTSIKGHNYVEKFGKISCVKPNYTIEQVGSSLLYESFCFIFLAGLHGTT